MSVSIATRGISSFQPAGLFVNAGARFYSQCAVFRQSVQSEDLLNVINRQCFALIVPKYCEKHVCDFASNKIKQLRLDEYDNPQEASEMNGLCMAYFESKKDKEEFEPYCEHKSRSMDKLEVSFYPFKNPIDKLKQELNNAWLSGSNTLNFENGDAFTGVATVINSQPLPHIDNIISNKGDKRAAHDYIAMLAAKIYLKVPKIGGELCFWDLTLDDKEYDKMCGDSDGIDPKKLPPPDIEIKPSQGDLILFNPQKLHMVKIHSDCSDKLICYSSFIKYAGQDKPLSFWNSKGL
ncbi:MAG: hypothetical protein WD595_04785 [Waddliaceae bacterium]